MKIHRYSFLMLWRRIIFLCLMPDDLIRGPVIDLTNHLLRKSNLKFSLALQVAILREAPLDEQNRLA